MDVKARMTSPFHSQENGAAERTNQTMKQVLMTVALAKYQQQNVGPNYNWWRLPDMVEIAINYATIANTELSLSTRTSHTTLISGLMFRISTMSDWKATILSR